MSATVATPPIAWSPSSRRASRPSSWASSSRSSGSTGPSSTCRGGTTWSSPRRCPGLSRRPRRLLLLRRARARGPRGRRHRRRAGLARRPLTGGGRGGPRGASARRAAGVDLQRGLPHRRRGPARRRGGGDALAVRGAAGRPASARGGQRRRALRRRRQSPDVGGQRRGDRPVPAHRAPRSRGRDRQFGRAPAGHPAASRRWAGAADRAADAGTSRRRSDRVRDGVGAGAPRPAARPGGARGPRVHERPHVHAPLPEGDRDDPRPLAARAARAREPGAAGGGDASIEAVAGTVGFASAATYRHHFASIMRTSPTAYRRAFYAASE